MKLNKRFFSIVLFLMFFLSCFINILCNYINCININALSENNNETLYDLLGRIIKHPNKGFYIKKVDNITTKVIK